jgi:hypothetical protein
MIQRKAVRLRDRVHLVLNHLQKLPHNARPLYSLVG